MAEGCLGLGPNEPVQLQVPPSKLQAQMVKNMPAILENAGSILGLGRSPGEGNGNPLQYSRPENFMDRGAWQATVHGLIESDTTEQLTLSLSRE